MPTRSKAHEVLVDTSVAVALVVADHTAHAATVDALRRRRLGLCGHAAFETFSVLTRLPGSARRRPEVIAELLAANFPATRHLSAAGASKLLRRLASAGIGGGSVYDALVGAAAAEHGMTLVTRDRRALETYRALEVGLEVLSSTPS